MVPHPDAEAELANVSIGDRKAILHAMEKLQALGPNLGYPHSSDVKQANDLRELRPRQGRCQWRAFYRRVGDAFVIAAISPEADVNPRKFTRAITLAEERLKDIET